MATPPDVDHGKANTRAGQQADRAVPGSTVGDSRSADSIFAFHRGRFGFVLDGVISWPSGWCVSFRFRLLVSMPIPWLSQERRPQAATALHLLAGRPLPGAQGQQILRNVVAKAPILVPYTVLDIASYVLFCPMCVMLHSSLTATGRGLKSSARLFM